MMMPISEKKLLFLLAFTLLAISSCIKDKPDDVNEKELYTTRKIWVANEGNFGSGNASLSIIYPEDKAISNGMEIGGKAELGDVFQSMTVINGDMFLAMNNSHKIIVVDTVTMHLKKEIQIRSPRYILQVNTEKAYISSLYQNKIWILDLKNWMIKDSIEMEYKNTEGMLMHEGKVYAAIWDTACNSIYEIDPDSDQIIRQINIAGYAPQQILADKNNDLWVLSGNPYANKAPYFTKLDAKTAQIKASYSFGLEADIMKATWNKAKDTLYYLSVNYTGKENRNGLYCMDIDAVSAPQEKLIAAAPFQYFWGLGFDIHSNTIYIGDPKGFIQRGAVYQYNTKGELLHTYDTEIGPGFFFFD